MIVGIGIDIVENSRIDQLIKSHKIRFLNKFLTKKELENIMQNNISSRQLTGIFAVKEATIKSVSDYLGLTLNYQDIEVSKNNKVPFIKIINIKKHMQLKKINIMISISHEKNYSVALAIAELKKD